MLQTSFFLFDGRQLPLFPADAPQASPAASAPLDPTFVDHAHFLLLHADEILADSRMLLAPIVGLKSTLVFERFPIDHIPLGAMIEWWRHNLSALHLDRATDALLPVCRFHRTPFAGRVGCTVADEDGTPKRIGMFDGSPDDLSQLGEICASYAHYVHDYAHFSLAQVVDRLRQLNTDLTLRRLHLHLRYWRAAAESAQAELKELRVG
ncbi:MAG: hypothetical protein HUK09_04605 [Bacteroidaceae bacterium]|nr:hypothetical protein [Bacteroidaceae bacterium]